MEGVSERQLGQVLRRRAVLQRLGGWLGWAALASMSGRQTAQASGHFPARAKRVISLFMHGGPSHLDLFDYKAALNAFEARPLPEELTKGVHFAQISRQTTRPLVRPSPFPFARYGQSSQWVSSLLPHLADTVDELAVIRSMHGQESTHDSAVHFLNTGFNRVGRPTMGAWLSHGLGSENANLPTYVVLTSGVRTQPLLESYWSSGFLPSRHQGVEFRAQGNPVLYLSQPEGVSSGQRRRQLDLLRWMNQRHQEKTGDDEMDARIEQHELAFRMQTAVPELTNLATENPRSLAAYGALPGVRSFAANCLLARRMAERGVRFIQLYDMGWDTHEELPKQLPRQCRAVDRPIAALIRDLKERGLLDETLLIWGGEFGRTPVVEGQGHTWGRDHHPQGFTMWMAGGGIRPGLAYGETDEFGFHARVDPVEVHDLHATALHCLGLRHEELTIRHEGQDVRLTDVRGQVIRDLLA